MALLLLGALLGLLVGYWQSRRVRREAEHHAEERQLVLQEKQIVVDFMHSMVEALGENLSREALLERIVHASILSTGALSACVFERTPRATLRAAAVEGLFPPLRPLPEVARQKATSRARFLEEILRSEELPEAAGLVGEVVRTREALLVANAALDPRVVTHDDPALRVTSMIVAPVAFRGEIYGVLCVVNSADGLPFNENDFSIVCSLAEQAGMALHNQSLLQYQLEKRQLDLDLSLASSIQQLLLPREVPMVAGLALDARYRPAQQIGGDFYDLIPLPGGRLGIGVADVSGKGIAASLLMAICRTNLRQFALRHDSPAAVLAAVNRAMGGEIRPGMFITMIYGIVDPARDEIVFARAGHELPLLLRGSAAAAEYLASDGMPIGLVPPEVFEPVLVERRARFAPGDVFVLYTDGLTEAPNEVGAEFSGARLLDAVRNLGSLLPAAINDGILERVLRFSGSDTLRDDFTLVTVRRV
ncbi:MAG TPA: GAF domain-containing SpoIIE family protein phosphatase [Opitutaceae bacterium]|nr:GAF domain-containing SpoIIE family protein phosphatase [Opitutaceae bacterium]